MKKTLWALLHPGPSLLHVGPFLRPAYYVELEPWPGHPRRYRPVLRSSEDRAPDS